jgi:r-opsin
MFTKNRFVLEGFLTSCSFNYLTQDVFTKTMIYTMFILGFFMPLLTIVISYLFMYLNLRTNDMFLSYRIRYTQRKKNSNISERILEMEEQICLNGKTKFDLEFASKVDSSKDKKILRVNRRTIEKVDGILQSREIKLAKMIFLMIGCFGLSWLPYSFICIYAQFGSSVKTYVTPLTTSMAVLIAKTSSFYNPIVYTLSNRECRLFFYKNLFRKK